VGWNTSQGKDFRLALQGSEQVQLGLCTWPCKKGQLMKRQQELTACPGAQGAHSNGGHVGGAGSRHGHCWHSGSWAVHSTIAVGPLRAILAGGGASIRVATSGAGCTHKVWFTTTDIYIDQQSSDGTECQEETYESMLHHNNISTGVWSCDVIAHCTSHLQVLTIAVLRQSKDLLQRTGCRQHQFGVEPC
jgi:hypothetical protein